VNPSGDLQFNDKGAQNVRNFGSYNVVKLPGGKTGLQSPHSGQILPQDHPMGGEEIMRMRKLGIYE